MVGDADDMPPSPSAGPADPPDRGPRDRQLDDVLEMIGRQARTRNVARAATVAAVLAECPDVSSQRLDEGVRAAHKLAGSAGTFGMSGASALARTLERFLTDGAASGDPVELSQARSDVAELERLLASP